MAFKIDVRPGEPPVRWETDGEGVTATADPEYEPALYAAARNDRTRYLDWLESVLAANPKVTDVAGERWKRSLAADPSPVLRVRVESLSAVRQVAREIRQREHRDHAPGVVPLYDVDLDPQFRYCLDTGRDPAPDRAFRTLSLSLPPAALARGDLAELRVAGESVAGGMEAVCERVREALAARDPDVLVLSSGDLVPLLADAGVDIGRRSGYRKLAGESTYASYGQVGHSPARYDVPGRALVDRSNSFLLGKSSLAGVRYFVARAGKPIQEVARDSIGGVLTSLEVRRARERGVLAPWQKRQTEDWKPADALYDADRGGFTYAPEPGVHEHVHQLDFASLYPNIIREYNVSPETVACDCCATSDVPDLGYSVCERDGFLGDVLGPLLDDRREWKRALREAGDDADTTELEAKKDAVKWVLVSCFGYQGYRHAKFGRIETHEAINAYARDILLDAADALEAAGWDVVHGIVDSLWVTPAPGRDQRPVREVASEVTDAVGIELEYEGAFDWLAFCPRKRATGAALMRYFGSWADEDGYKLRGVEARQRSTCAFVEASQRAFVAGFDRERDPEAVCDALAGRLADLRRGDVPASDLAITQRVSKTREAYQRASRSRAALARADAVGFDRRPGQSVEYVVADDDATGSDRVRLAFEDGDDYDPDFYADRLLRAAESVLAPLGWDERRIRRWLADTENATLDRFASET